MKKILMILDHEFPPDIRVENEIESLVKSGHELHVACYTQKGLEVYEQLENCTVHRRPISKFIFKSSVGALKFPFYFNFWRTFIDKLCKEYQYDAIHVHDLPMARVGYEMSKRYGVKYVIDLHENWPALLRVATHTQSFLGKLLSNNRQWEKFELEYCHKADTIIVVVDEAKDRLQKSGIDPTKIKVVSNTLNLNHFKVPLTEPDQDFITLLYAGGINKHRGLQYVIKGLKYLHDLPKPVRLWILGDGSYLQNLKDIAKSEGVESMVIFAGWKEFEEMQKYFGKADIGLIPHAKNNHTDSTIPHKIFQYMYAGKAVVVSNCAPLDRIINETKSGMVYQFDSPKDFADKITVLSERPEMLNILTSESKMWIEKKYNWAIDSQTLIKVYENL